jgi:tRNA A37 threonylcarbamoyladenosine dehydratase
VRRIYHNLILVYHFIPIFTPNTWTELQCPTQDTVAINQGHRGQFESLNEKVKNRREKKRKKKKEMKMDFVVFSRERICNSQREREREREREHTNKNQPQRERERINNKSN